MNKYKFEYFLRAILYQLWIIDVWFSRIIQRILFNSIGLFATGEIRKKMKEQQESLKPSVFVAKDGINMACAKYLFGLLYSSYPAVLSFTLGAMVIKATDELNIWLIIIVFAIPVIVAYIPAEKILFKKECYIEYFKTFEKEDKQWHKKWRLITWLFIICAIIAYIIGIAAMWIVFLYF